MADTRGSGIIVIKTRPHEYPSDSQGNTYTLARSTSREWTWYCYEPKTSAEHTFTGAEEVRFSETDATRK